MYIQKQEWMVIEIPFHFSFMDVQKVRMGEQVLQTDLIDPEYPVHPVR